MSKGPATASRRLPELHRVSDRFLYEAEMVISSAKVLGSRIAGRENPVARALRESFLIHLRIVVDFLFPRDLDRGDIPASGFFDSPSQWSDIRDRHINEGSRRLLTVARDRAERELARLVRKGKSSERLKEGPDRKKWECVRICEEIRKAVRIFLEHAPKERLGPKWEPALRQDPSCRYTPPPGVE